MIATQAVSRNQINSIIDDEMQQWDSLVSEIGLSSFNQPGFMGEWTFIDAAAHLTAWRQQTIDRLHAAAHDLPEPASEIADDTDHRTETSNQMIYEREHDRSEVDVLHEAHDSYGLLKRAVEALSLDDLGNPDRFAWLDGRSLNEWIVDRTFFDHFHVEHEPEIRARIAQIGLP